MRPTFAAFYCLYDDEEWLELSVRSIYPAVDAVYFLVSDIPWNGPLTGNDSTLACIRALPDPEGKLRVLQGRWATEVEQRNTALAAIAVESFDYAFIIDADEIYDSAALSKMMEYAAREPEVGAWHCWFNVYWKSPRYRIDPPERHHPPVFLKTGTGGFVEYRNLRSSSHKLIPAEIGFCHHLSYARTDEQILRKITSFSHSHQVRADWFEQVWKAWDKDHTIGDLCPYNPGVFERAVEMPDELLPEVLREYLHRRS